MAESNRNSYGARSKPAVRHLWLKWLIRPTLGLLYIGRANKDFYLWMGAKEGRLFPCPYSIDNDRFAEAQQRFLAEKEIRLAGLNLNPRLPTFLFCGKLIPKKRPEILLEGIAQGGL